MKRKKINPSGNVSIIPSLTSAFVTAISLGTKETLIMGMMGTFNDCVQSSHLFLPIENEWKAASKRERKETAKEISRFLSRQLEK